MIRVLSLGAGVQSSAVLLMSCRGVLPKVDAAIFADTQWEPPAVQDTLAFLATEAKKARIPVFVRTKGSLRDHSLRAKIKGNRKDGDTYAAMPLWVRGLTDQGD